MRWTERQRAMLREMGIRLWLPEDAPWSARPVATVEAEAAVAGEARPSPSSTRAPAARSTPALASKEPRDVPGIAPADWLVVGEGAEFADPQEHELLANMLRAIGVGLVMPTRERRAVYVGQGAPAAAGEGATAFADVAPRCVLALGRAAAARLLGTDAPLGSLRGRVHAYGAVPLVVTFSLAYLLRNPAEKAKAWADLCLAVGALSAS